MGQDIDGLRALIQAMDEQRIRKRESVRAAMKAEGVPMPQAIVNDLSVMNPQDALEVLKDHPGFKIWQRWNSYKAALAIFEQCMRDLLDAIDGFADQIRAENLFSRANQYKLDQGALRIHKELLSAGNAAHSLKDHASYRLQKVARVREFEARLTEHFGQDGLHDFVIALRTITHHVKVLEPGHTIVRRGRMDADEISFQLRRDDLKAVVESVKAESGKYKINKLGRDYLEGCPEDIDVRRIYQEYFRRACDFHTWFRGEFECRPTRELQDFERCLEANSNHAIRTGWKMLLGNWLKNWKTPPNPYQHLDQYLTADQLQLVMHLPKKSREQVNKIIEFVDNTNACDDEIREMAYKLFARAPD